MKQILSGVLLLLAWSSANAASIVIDDFTSTDPGGGWGLAPTTSNVAVTKSETGLSGVYGGTRDTVYTANFTGSTSGISMDMGSGESAQNNKASSWSKVTLTYDGGGGLGGLNLDLTSGTKLSVDRIFDHLGYQKNTVFSITLYDGAQSATVSNIWTTPEVSNVLVTQDFLFSDFLSQNALLNLSSIDSIELYLETDQAGDYLLQGGLTATTVVPIPAAAWLFGSALGVMGVMRRKRSS